MVSASRVVLLTFPSEERDEYENLSHHSTPQTNFSDTRNSTSLAPPSPSSVTRVPP